MRRRPISVDSQKDVNMVLREQELQQKIHTRLTDSLLQNDSVIALKIPKSHSY